MTISKKLLIVALMATANFAYPIVVTEITTNDPRMTKEKLTTFTEEMNKEIRDNRSRILKKAVATVCAATMLTGFSAFAAWKFIKSV